MADDADGAEDYFALVAEWQANREKKERLEEAWEEIDRKIGLLQIDLVKVNWELREAKKAHLELTARVSKAAEAAFGMSTIMKTGAAGKAPALMLRFMR
jgi:diketogulonate reductase-like aldo/keto reductase